MHHGRLNMIKDIDATDLKKWGCNTEIVIKVVTLVNKLLTQREVPLVIFFQPDLEKYSKEFSIEPKELFNTLNFLTIYRPDSVKLDIFFKDDELQKLYKLQNEDLEILNTENKFYHPDKPQIIYEKPDYVLRRAFSIGV